MVVERRQKAWEITSHYLRLNNDELAHKYDERKRITSVIVDGKFRSISFSSVWVDGKESFFVVIYHTYYRHGYKNTCIDEIYRVTKEEGNSIYKDILRSVQKSAKGNIYFKFPERDSNKIINF